MKKLLFLSLSIILIFSACSNKQEKEIEIMKKKISQFSETELKYDHSLLDENQKKVMENIYLSAKQLDKIFLDQVYSKNKEIKKKLENSTDELSKLQLDYFNIMTGPFDRLDHNKPFYGNAAKPLGANFYPEDMTKEEFENWIKTHPEDEKAFTSEFTVIRRDGDKLMAIPYSEYYKNELTIAADYLRKAAEFADNPTLKKYLRTRANAFLSNDYFQSDMDWMDLKDHTIEVITGPYEVYEDELFNYKASFECFLTLVDPAETAKLKKFASYLTEMEKNLPIPDKFKNFNRGSESPIMVVQEVFSAGDTKAGVQTLAFNLPNDERVRAAKGSKKVLLKNMHEAKFEKLLKPIASVVIDESQQKYISFDGFFTHTLMHEMSHGVGPGFIVVNGKETEVKKELKETYSTMEECKADILGMWNNLLMIQKGVLSDQFERQMWVTFLAGTFRSMRFGIGEAHGGGNAIIYNFLLEKDAYEYDAATQKVRVNFDIIKPALHELANKVLMIQALGDYKGAKDLMAKYKVESESMTTLIEKLKSLPVDIHPIFEIEKEMNK